MKKLSLAMLIIGLIFGQLIIFTFNLNEGIVFHKILIRIIPIADYAGKYSPETVLHSTLLGYIAFVIFGVINTNKNRYPKIFKSALMFSAVSLVVSFFEFTSILEDIDGTYQGKYFRIGWLLFFLGLWIFSKNYLSKK